MKGFLTSMLLTGIGVMVVLLVVRAVNMFHNGFELLGCTLLFLALSLIVHYFRHVWSEDDVW